MGAFHLPIQNMTFLQIMLKSTFTNEVLSFAKEATKKDPTFWNQLRPVPLTKEEVKDYKIKDSLKGCP